ncbi:LysR family transcriptional regulator [Desulfolithobacter dissulfuricans]|uniref:LysR family transcriptional regulator n=1 Tax=Desulfolithobacter dissulfuricans TaxID=2795293 RepID=A0A915U8I2_9BACT|nr:LysR family transcriptional regulator [Desulfolithobacter dissulfuricans]BCO08046.1 LysR family transcriptional regulator [Desulfolithobacter dissulfuricans]
MPITLRQLEIFIAVADTQQVTKAAKKLYLTQSAVSMALGELENNLGGPLFDRHGRSLLLNDRGRYLLPLSKEILYQVGNIEAMLTEKRDTVAGSLEIVASSTIGNYVLPYLIGTFMRMHPAVHINMLVLNTRYAEKRIASGEMDLGFVEGQVSDEMVRAVPWFEDELVVIVSPTHPLANEKAFKVPDDLERTTWVIREEGSGTAAIFKKKLGRYASHLKIKTKLGHTEAIKKAVESGAGAGCLSSLTVCREIEHGWLKSLPVEGIDMQRQLLIIHHREKITTRLMDEFLSFCEVMSECGLGRACLSSPWKLQALLTEYSMEKEQNKTEV